MERDGRWQSHTRGEGVSDEPRELELEPRAQSPEEEEEALVVMEEEEQRDGLTRVGTS